MSNNRCGLGCSNSRTFSQVIGYHLGTFRTAIARRRAMRELEAMPLEARKDIGWRSDF